MSGCSGHADLCDRRHDASLHESHELLLGIPDIEHPQAVALEGRDVERHPGRNVNVPADDLADLVVLGRGNRIPPLRDDCGHCAASLSG